jgi:NhaC family Na+:H+ antiporter
MKQEQQAPSLLMSIIPFLLLIVLLSLNVYLYADTASSGPNQVALLLCAAVAAFIGIFKQKIPYKTIEDGMIEAIGLSLQAVIILLVVGSLIGLWIVSGIVPTMIFYGLKLINPTIFLPVCTIVCCLVSLSTGSSWSTSGTVGVALIAIGQTLGLPLGLVAGAVISGAYFGDKMSPLSDTTNLAPAMAGTDLFSHVRHMVYTSGPAIILTIIIFAVIGVFYTPNADIDSNIVVVMDLMKSKFFISPILFILPVLVIVLVFKKVPALPALFVGCLLGVVIALIFQRPLLASLSEGNLGFTSMYKLFFNVAFEGVKLSTNNEMIDSLLSRGGMKGMMNTIWLIITAMIFGGALEKTKMLETIAMTLLKKVQSVAGLIAATLGSCIFVNISASDQYLSIVVPGRMFRKAYDDKGLDPKNLSRALEDAGTVTSVLVPWNTCGAYTSSVLGVATLTYLPFCFFNLLSPIISLILGITGWTIVKKLKPNL